MRLSAFIKWFIISVAVIFFTACTDKESTEKNNDLNTPIKILKSFSYDNTNRVVKEDLGDGKYIEYIYDDSGNLIQQTVVK